MMNRDQALALVKASFKNKNLVYHSLAVEAVMRALAEKLSEDKDAWGIVGLLHDVDYEITADDFNNHGLKSVEMLADSGMAAELLHAISAHNPMTGVKRESLLDKALYAADPITGLLTACALVKPTKKMAEVEVKSVKKKFKDKAFARGANREQIDSCTEIDMERGDFIALALDAMKSIAGEIGL